MQYVPALTNAAVWAGSVFLIDQINKKTIRLVNMIEKILVPLMPKGTPLDPAITQTVDIAADAAVAGFALVNTGLSSYVGSILTQNYLGSGAIISAAMATAIATFLMIKLAAKSSIAAEVYEDINLVIGGAFIAGFVMQLM